MKYAGIISSLLFLLMHNIAAQECQLIFSGRVLDRATREPLEYTTVAIPERNLSLLADSLGQFSFTSLCPGQFHVILHHLGCPPGDFFVTFSEDTVMTFLLDHQPELLREIKVEGKSDLFNESQVQQAISASTIKSKAGQTLADLVSDISGVRMISSGSGITKPIIHGLYGNRIAIINNGLLQAGQQWGADHAPEIDPNTSNQITVVKGSDAIEYGSQALGGAIRVEAGPIIYDPHLHGYLGYAFESNGLSHTVFAKVNQSFSKLDMRISASGKRAGDHRTPEYFLTNTGVSELSSSIQFHYRASEKVQHQFFYSYFNTRLGIFAGSHISNLTDLEQAIGREEPFNIKDEFSYTIAPPKQEVTHHLWRYGGKKFWSDHSFLDWSYGAQYNHRQEFDIRRGDRSNIPALDLKLWSHVLDLKWVGDQPAFKIKTGMQLRFTNNYNSFETGILPLIPDYNQGDLGAFASFQRPWKSFTAEAGLRYDLHLLRAWAITTTLPYKIDQRDHVLHDGALSLGAVFHPGTFSNTRLNIVAARRSPAPNELYSNGLHQGIAGIEEGDRTLQPETSIKTILDQSFKFEEVFHFSLSLYSHSILDYIYLKPQPDLRLTIRGAFPVYKYTQEDVWIRGLDVLVVSDFSHQLEWSAKLSLIRGSRSVDKEDLTSIPPANVNSTLSWTFKDSRVWKSMKVHLEADYTASQNQWDETSELLAPPGDYFLLNFRWSTGIQLKHQIFYAGVSMDNILNVRYRNYLNRLRYFAHEEGINARVFVRYEF